MGAQPVYETNVLLTTGNRTATGPASPLRPRSGVGAARPAQFLEKVGQ